MREEKQNRLPPIVVDYIEKLRNKKQSSFQREMYCAILEQIRNACDVEIQHYINEKAKDKQARR